MYNNQIVERHIGHIRSILAFLGSRTSYDLPQPLPTALNSVNQIISDFEFLLDQVEILTKECESGMGIMMQNALTMEAKNQLQQAQEVAKLTKPCVRVCPTWFTTSLFGMNAREFASASTFGITTRVAISVPIVVVSFLFMMVDGPALAKQPTAR